MAEQRRIGWAGGAGGPDEKEVGKVSEWRVRDNVIVYRVRYIYTTRCSLTDQRGDPRLPNIQVMFSLRPRAAAAAARAVTEVV